LAGAVRDQQPASKELGYLSGVPGRLSNGFVTFPFSMGRPKDAAYAETSAKSISCARLFDEGLSD